MRQQPQQKGTDVDEHTEQRGQKRQDAKRDKEPLARNGAGMPFVNLLHRASILLGH